MLIQLNFEYLFYILKIMKSKCDTIYSLKNFNMVANTYLKTRLGSPNDDEGCERQFQVSNTRLVVIDSLGDAFLLR